MTPTIITTCKGRLAQLSLALESWLSATPCLVLVVADGCPDISTGLQEGSLRNSPVLDPRVRIFWTGALNEDYFSKPRALNLGAKLASTNDLLFLDSDTLVFSGFWDWYSRRLAEDALFIVPPSTERRDLTGVLGVSKREFEAVGGADTGFIGWGSEDLDLRLRLFLSRDLRVVHIPDGMLAAIPHDDGLRTRHYPDPDKLRSHEKNVQRLVDNAERITGKSMWALLEEPGVRALFGQGLGPLEKL
jgi:N-terminal domain of galactosyltransferase